ncbi:MAG: peptidoglycan-binding domain-containing protein [Chthoniobacterales bacterium]
MKRGFGFALFCQRAALLSFCALGCIGSAAALDDVPFHSSDPLAPRDEWAVLHRNPSLDRTDYAPRYPSRLLYYLQSRNELALDPAYIGSLQTSLRRLGYYCGPIDGSFSLEVTDAIARLQKAYAMRVSGSLTPAVRRALRMP